MEFKTQSLVFKLGWTFAYTELELIPNLKLGIQTSWLVIS